MAYNGCFQIYVKHVLIIYTDIHVSLCQIKYISINRLVTLFLCIGVVKYISVFCDLLSVPCLGPDSYKFVVKQKKGK